MMHTTNVRNKSMYQRRVLGDLWRFHLTEHTWEPVFTCGNLPGPRHAFGARLLLVPTTVPFCCEGSRLTLCLPWISWAARLSLAAAEKPESPAWLLLMSIGEDPAQSDQCSLQRTS